jgi:transposase-like protein
MKEVKTMSNEKKKAEKVRMKIISPMIYEWICPSCGNVNHDEHYSPVYRTKVRCRKCGKKYTGER